MCSVIFNKFGNTQSISFFVIPPRIRLAHAKDVMTTLVGNILIKSLAVPVGNMK